MKALQPSLLASLEVPPHEMLDAQLPQAFEGGCSKASEPCGQDIDGLKRQQTAVTERVAQLEINPARNHADLMAATVSKNSRGAARRSPSFLHRPCERQTLWT